MQKNFFLLIFLVNSPLIMLADYKIVGLVPARNESSIIEQCLRALATYTDAIVVLDDASDDNTVEIVESLANELNIEKIIRKKTPGWLQRTERENRQALLNTGREIGGTHFIQVDADEMLTANCAKDNWLRNEILSLKRGQLLNLPMMHPWRSLNYYRDDYVRWSPLKCMVCVALCDDGICNQDDNVQASHSGFIHTARFPVKRDCSEPDRFIKDINHGILHFRFVNWKSIMIKRAWYMCLERIRLAEKLSLLNPDRTIDDINKFYTVEEPFTEHDINLKPMPKEWYSYDFFDPQCFINPDLWRKKEVLGWFEKYGRSYFEKLDIWSINWDED